MSEHTKEPWSVGQNGRVQIGRKGTREHAETVVGSYNYEEDARRIVACVNACAGLSTEALESGALKIALQNMWSYLDYVDDENHSCSAGPAWNTSLRAYLAKLEGK